MSSRMVIDPKKFALGFADTATQKGINQGKVVEEAKKYLLSYLTAYYLVDDFNKVEQQNFEAAGKQDGEQRFEDMTFEQLMDRVRNLNKY